MATPSVAGKSKQSKPDPNRGDGPLATAPSDPNSSPAPLSWYESQKRRDWNTFLQYLQNQKPPLTLAGCRDNHVIDFLRYLDQFGKTKVHTTGCLFFGHPNPPAPCPCPLRQAWGSLDALIGRLRSAYEEHGGRPESNPFAGLAVRVYLREVREHQAKAGGTRRYKKRKGKRLTIVTDKTVMASKEQGGNATGTGGDGSDSAAQTTSTTTTSDAMEETIEMRRQPQLDLEVLEKLQDAEKAKRELKQQEYFDTKLANEEHEKDIWGAAASGISSAAASAVGTAAGDEVYKYAKEIINNLSCKVDSEADYDLENNYERLIEQAKKLYACRDDILAQAKTKLVTQVYEAWISRVKMSEEEVRDLETKYKKIKGKNRTWSPRLIGSSVSRTDLSQSMAEKCKKLHNLWVEGKSEIGIVVEKLPERVIIMHGPKSEDKIFLESYVEEILGHLRDKNVKRIGLWGMSGIGKTTIMQSLNNNEDTAKMFDIVIWVTVSKDWNLEKLQHKIADRLKLNMEGITDPNEIAQLICRDLKSKRCLLLLDEVREVLDLPLIGMCESEKDSKVVVASRNYHVCCDMETDLEIDVKRLSEADAWKMFKVKVGRNVNLPGIEPIAKLVVSECAGLPLLIDKVASMFRRKDNFHLWSDGLRSLRRWPSIKIQGIDELIEYLKFCYEDLDDEVKKACFLYGAIYPEDYEIYKDYLLECWRAEGFIHDTSEFRVARDKGHSILEELISISLLEKSAKMNHVRMNKVIRNMALNISSRSCNFKILVKPREGLQEAPNEVEWQQANRISLMDNKLCTLPEMPDCNELSTLLLQRNQDLIVIPETFFGCMQNLRVLDLHGTGITSLPSSISCLKRLKALYLHSCSCLMELRYLEGLEHLEVLDIRDTSLNHFPIQIGRLNQLKCLRMSLSNFGIRHSSNIEYCRSVFSSLLLLEELLIDVDPNNQSWEVTMKTISEGVAKLTHLTSLSICFPTVDCLKSFISTSQLWKDFRFTFQFSVGYHDTTLYKILDCFEYQIRKCLKFANGEGVDPIISDVLLETDAFELIGHKGTSRLSDFGIESINKMRGCLIEGCNEIETIVDGNRVKRSALTCLEKMFINNVPNLKSIWEGPVHNGSLSQLTTLTLCKCLKLKKIFSGGMIKQLSQLQHVKVEDCPEIEEIIAESENNGLKPDALPRLKMLELSNLPRVKSIWTSDSLKWPSLEKIKISMCQMLTKLPFNSENAINLRCIEAHQTWWSALACQDDAIEQRLRSLWFQSPS